MMKGDLTMSNIAVIITGMFEDSEYSEPARAFKEAGDNGFLMMNRQKR